VESAEVAQVILEQARAFNCSTIVVGRRGLSRVKEFFLGSVSKSLVGFAKNRTVWVVDA
jgi:nucleotide-binding universal stress UspA family protein